MTKVLNIPNDTLCFLFVQHSVDHRVSLVSVDTATAKIFEAIAIIAAQLTPPESWP
jgi:hypothetical protein